MKLTLKLWLAAALTLAAGAAFAEGVAPAVATQTTWSRFNVNFDASPVAIVTVPTNLTKPYFLKQAFGTAYNYGIINGYTVLVPYSGCEMYANGVPAVELMSSGSSDLNVPFKAGDVLTLNCGSAARWTFVFAN